MPTYERLARFRREYSQLSPELRAAFLEALAQFIEHADSGQFRPSLRVKRVRSSRLRLWEMSFAQDGRATFEMVPGAVRSGVMHIRWHRIGDHSILDQ